MGGAPGETEKSQEDDDCTGRSPENDTLCIAGKGVVSYNSPPSEFLPGREEITFSLRPLAQIQPDQWLIDSVARNLRKCISSLVFKLHIMVSRQFFC